MFLITRIRTHSAKGHRLVLWNWSLVREVRHMNKAMAFICRKNIKETISKTIFSNIQCNFNYVQ